MIYNIVDLYGSNIYQKNWTFCQAYLCTSPYTAETFNLVNAVKITASILYIIVINIGKKKDYGYIILTRAESDGKILPGENSQLYNVIVITIHLN